MEILDKFYAHIKGNAMSNRTLENYQRSLELLCRHYEITKDEDLINLTKIEIIEYLQYIINEKKIEASTRNTYFSGIRAFYSYLDFVKIEYDKEIFDIKNIAIKQKRPIYLKNQEAYLLLNSLNHIKSKAIVEILLKTGIRVEELINIKMSNMKVYTNELDYEEYEIKIMGKGNKERYIYIDNDCKKTIDKYIKTSRKKIIENTKTELKDYLFLSRKGRLLTRDEIRKIISRCAERIGLNDYNHMSPHKLRHTYATLNTQSNIDIETIRESMGHTDIKTTQRYLHTEEAQIKKAQTQGYMANNKNNVEEDIDTIVKNKISEHLSSNFNMSDMKEVIESITKSVLESLQNERKNNDDI